MNEPYITIPAMRTDNKVQQLYNGKKVLIFKPKIDVFWPEPVRNLAQAMIEGRDCCFALHDALLELGLPKNAKHFADPVCFETITCYGELGKQSKIFAHDSSCVEVKCIAIEANPEWGCNYWCLGPNRTEYLEMQNELDTFWGFDIEQVDKFFYDDNLKEWITI